MRDHKFWLLKFGRTNSTFYLGIQVALGNAKIYLKFSNRFATKSPFLFLNFGHLRTCIFYTKNINCGYIRI